MEDEASVKLLVNSEGRKNGLLAENYAKVFELMKLYLNRFQEQKIAAKSFGKRTFFRRSVWLRILIPVCI